MSEPAAPDPCADPGPDSDFDEWTAWLYQGSTRGAIPSRREREPARGWASASATRATWTCSCWRPCAARTGWAARRSSAAFGQDKAADVLCPGPVLAALTAQTAADPAASTDDELIGALQAARRLANHADYKQTVVIAEFARRRQAQFEAAMAAGKPVGCRDGEFPGEELAMELVETAPTPVPGSTRPSS